MNAVVIGVGAEFRRDDGIGLAVAREVARHGVRAEVCDGDPVRLMETWEGADLVVVVDAVRCRPSFPGRWYRTGIPQGGTAASSHGLGVPEAVELAAVLGRMPAKLVVFAVEVADTSFGPGLSPEVEASITPVTEAVLAEVRRIDAG